MIPYLGALTKLWLLAVGFGAVLNTYFGLQRFEPVSIPAGRERCTILIAIISCLDADRPVAISRNSSRVVYARYRPEVSSVDASGADRLTRSDRSHVPTVTRPPAITRMITNRITVPTNAAAANRAGLFSSTLNA